MTWALESLKNLHFNRLFLSKVYIVWAKRYRGVVFHETEERYKIWRGSNLSFQNRHKEFVKFWLERLKVSKIFTLMGSLWAKYIVFELKYIVFEKSLKNFFVLIGSLWPKHILFELQKYIGVIFHDTEELCKFWRKTD